MNHVIDEILNKLNAEISYAQGTHMPQLVMGLIIARKIIEEHRQDYEHGSGPGEPILPAEAYKRAPETRKLLTVRPTANGIELDYNDSDPPVQVPNLTAPEVLDRINSAHQEGYAIDFKYQGETEE